MVGLRILLVEYIYLSIYHIQIFVANGLAQISCLCDASNKVYATAIYLKNITDDAVNLLFSKAQNAISRPKLLSVLIGVRSLLLVTKALKIEAAKIIIWPESKCLTEDQRRIQSIGI